MASKKKPKVRPVHFHLIIKETARCIGEVFGAYSKAGGLSAMKAVEEHEYTGL